MEFPNSEMVAGVVVIHGGCLRYMFPPLVDPAGMGVVAEVALG